MRGRRKDSIAGKSELDKKSRNSEALLQRSLSGLYSDGYRSNWLAPRMVNAGLSELAIALRRNGQPGDSR